MSSVRPRLLPELAWFVLGALLFTLVCCQAPLYYSNQNQYFVHGLARTGYGHLADDWLANTLDPTPIFTAIITFSARLHPWLFYVYYGLLCGIYLAALVSLFRTLAGEQTASSRWLVFLALLMASHSGLARWESYRWLRQDYPWYLQTGLAGQYVLGGMFQPSVFGVLLLAAVALFARGRPFLAVVCIGLAATLHSTYLLSGAMLTLGFLTVLVAERSYRQAAWMALMALLLVLPVTLHVLLTFGPTDASTFAQAQDILVHFRIPHHTQPRLWLDTIAILQIAWMVLALALLWGTRLFLALAVPFALAVILTVVQWATDNPTLALLFPWRISSVLVPLATAIILARLTALPDVPLHSLAARLAALAVIAVVVAGGVWISATGQAYFTPDEQERDVMQYVHDHCRPGDVYLIPVIIPELEKTTSGSISSDFKPMDAKRRDARLIPMEMARFRLVAGGPIFVDFKSIPYKDTELIEWRSRLQQAHELQQQLQNGEVTNVLPELRRLGITHVVLPASSRAQSSQLQELYDDKFYRLYQISPFR